MLKMFCDKCKKEIQEKEMIMNIEMGEQDYLGGHEMLRTGYHRNFDLHLCNECRYELLQFLNIEEQEENRLLWE